MSRMGSNQDDTVVLCAKSVRRVREAVPPRDLLENSTFFAGFGVFAQRGSLKNPKKLIVTERHDYVWQFEGYLIKGRSIKWISQCEILRLHGHPVCNMDFASAKSITKSK